MGCDKHSDGAGVGVAGMQNSGPLFWKTDEVGIAGAAVAPQQDIIGCWQGYSQKGQRRRWGWYGTVRKHTLAT